MKIVTIILACVCTISASPVQTRIIGGALAKAGQFPFAAAITVTKPEGTYFCSGTLANHQYIITAGQCVDNTVRFAFFLGSNAFSGTGGEHFTSSEAVQHPDYTSEPLMNDIALIQIRLSLTFTDYIRPVNFLADADILPGSSTLILGWGQTSDADSSFADTLHWVYVATLSNDECKITYGDFITDEKVCVAGNNIEGTCHGDSGGALIQYGSRGTTYLVGVSSFVSEMGCELHPSGFTRVYPFKDWLDGYLQA